jgi:hypothetical protein
MTRHRVVRRDERGSLLGMVGLLVCAGGLFVSRVAEATGLSVGAAILCTAALGLTGVLVVRRAGNRTRYARALYELGYTSPQELALEQRLRPRFLGEVRMADLKRSVAKLSPGADAIEDETIIQELLQHSGDSLRFRTIPRRFLHRVSLVHILCFGSATGALMLAGLLSDGVAQRPVAIMLLLLLCFALAVGAGSAVASFEQADTRSTWLRRCAQGSFAFITVIAPPLLVISLGLYVASLRRDWALAKSPG